MANGAKAASQENVPRADRLRLGTGMIALFVVLTVLAYWLYSAEAQHLSDRMSADSALIVYREYLAVFFFAPLPALSLAAITLIHLLYKDILKKPLSRVAQFLQGALLGGMLLGLVLMVVGGYILDSKWETKFEASGYSRCDNTVLRFDKSFSHSAWMKRAEDCFDEKARLILHENHGRGGFELASKFLERKHRRERVEG